MLHGKIRNDDFKRNTALQCRNNVATLCCAKKLLRIISCKNILRPYEQNREKKMTAPQSNVMTISWQISAVKDRTNDGF